MPSVDLAPRVVFSSCRTAQWLLRGFVFAWTAVSFRSFVGQQFVGSDENDHRDGDEQRVDRRRKEAKRDDQRRRTRRWMARLGGEHPAGCQCDCDDATRNESELIGGEHRDGCRHRESGCDRVVGTQSGRDADEMAADHPSRRGRGVVPTRRQQERRGTETRKDERLSSDPGQRARNCEQHPDVQGRNRPAGSHDPRVVRGHG